MAEQMNIYQKLARIRKQVEVIQKNKSGYGYKYVSEDEILAKNLGIYGQVWSVSDSEYQAGQHNCVPIYIQKDQDYRQG